MEGGVQKVEIFWTPPLNLNHYSLSNIAYAVVALKCHHPRRKGSGTKCFIRRPLLSCQKNT